MMHLRCNFPAENQGRRLRRAAGCCLWLASLACLLPTTALAEQIELREDAVAARYFQVTQQVEISGKLFTPALGDKKTMPMPFSATASFGFEERRLPGPGRDARALRALRSYDKAQVESHVGTQVSYLRMRSFIQQIVAQGEREGLLLYSPQTPLTYSELELLRSPGDALAVTGLLPLEKVEVGETWEPADWAVQMLAGLEAVEKGEMSCKFESLTDGIAHISFTGAARGAGLGAPVDLQFTGLFKFDVAQHFIKHVELAQIDKRSAGAIAPGLDVQAKITVDRSLLTTPQRLTEDMVKQLPLEPKPVDLLLTISVPDWGIRFYHDRNWHVWQQTAKSGILRLMDKGVLISQCQLHPLPSAEPGKHLPEQQFQDEIRKVLGKSFGKILSAEKLDTKDDRFIYRVVVAGEAEATYQWVYYLVAGPDGRQVSFVFVIEPKYLEAIDGRDLNLIMSVEFPPPSENKSPTPAAP